MRFDFEKIALLLMGVFLFSGCGVEKNIPEVAKNFVVVTDESMSSLGIFDLSEYSRTRLGNVYDGLTATDENLEIVPSLATGWGRIDDNIWEFTIRKNVKYGDGSEMKLEDVVASFELAKSDKLKNFLGNIEKVEISEDGKILVFTKHADPMIPYRVSKVFVVPSGTMNGEFPAGSGAYKMINKEGDIILERNKNYWGAIPDIEKVYFVSGDRAVRTDAAKNNDCSEYADVGDLHCGFVASIPKDIGEVDDNFTEYVFSNLGTTFIIFNQNSEKMQSSELKNKLRKSLNKYKISEMAGGGFRPATQFFSSGVVGYNPEIKIPEYQKSAINEVVYVDYLEGFDPIANMLEEEWKSVGVNVYATKVASLEEMKNRAQSGESDMAILSWQVESGDGEEFFIDMVHSPSGGYGEYNFFGYRNNDVNKKILESEISLDNKKRLKLLREVAKIIVEDDMFGIPMFEQVRMQLVSDEFNFIPRADGLVDLKNITLK